MRIERKRIADMNRAAYNPRVELRPGDDEYEHLAHSIEKFGLVLPIIWNERTNNVVGGHQRLTVLENRGEDEVDVSVVTLDEMQEKQLNVALNKIGGNWDEELARLEQTFNLSLKFSKEDKAALNDYVKEYGKESLVRLIIEKVKGEI